MFWEGWLADGEAVSLGLLSFISPAFFLAALDVFRCVSECFYNKDGKWYYAGTYTALRLADLTPKEFEQLSNEVCLLSPCPSFSFHDQYFIISIYNSLPSLFDTYVIDIVLLHRRPKSSSAKLFPLGRTPPLRTYSKSISSMDAGR